jgi:hypothetical protein
VAESDVYLGVVADRVLTAKEWSDLQVNQLAAGILSASAQDWQVAGSAGD